MLLEIGWVFSCNTLPTYAVSVRFFYLANTFVHDRIVLEVVPLLVGHPGNCTDDGPGDTSTLTALSDSDRPDEVISNREQ